MKGRATLADQLLGKDRRLNPFAESVIPKACRTVSCLSAKRADVVSVYLQTRYT